MGLLEQQLARGEIEAAAARIRAFVRRTPVLVVDGADLALPGIRVAFKLEFTQHSGSFKACGAFNNLLSRAVPAAGVVAASGGNHGVAVAFAAMRLKYSARIFVPSVASRVKIEQIRALGATLEISGERYADALAASEEFALRLQAGARSDHRCTAVRSKYHCGELRLRAVRLKASIPDCRVACPGG